MYPCVVKPRSRGSSLGVSIVNNMHEYVAALELAFRYEDNIIVEQYIKGRNALWAFWTAGRCPH